MISMFGPPTVIPQGPEFITHSINEVISPTDCLEMLGITLRLYKERAKHWEERLKVCVEEIK
mgnify:CR=1 FL=1